MTVVSYSEVLKAARQLPLDDQVGMAEELLRAVLRNRRAESTGAKLVPLADMSLQELHALAESVVAPGDQQQLQALLAKNRRGALSAKEQKSLDDLLARADQVALLKARARYTLGLYRSDPEALG